MFLPELEPLFETKSQAAGLQLNQIRASIRVTIWIAGPSSGFTFTASTNFRRAWALSCWQDKAHYLDSGVIQSERAKHAGCQGLRASGGSDTLDNFLTEFRGR